MDKSYKRKNYYQKPGRGGGSWNNSKKKFKHYLTPGMKGFLCTCNMREQDCVKESLNVLNEYAEKIYGCKEAERPEATKAEGDIEDELQREVSQLRDSPRGTEKFSVVDTGVANNVFIKTTLDDPVKVAYTILQEAAETKVQKGRFLTRIVPIEVTCRANIDDIKTAADAFFDKHFRCEPTTFGIVINKRYNNSILRDELIHALALLVTDRNSEHKANLKEPIKTVLLEIIKGVCCMSVLVDYKKLRHYNLAELTKPDSEENTGPEASGGTEGEVKELEEEEKVEEDGEEEEKNGEHQVTEIGEEEEKKKEPQVEKEVEDVP